MLLNLKPSICRACLTRQSNRLSVRFASTHYSVLGITQNASQKEIRAAYLELSKKEHPDQNQDGKYSHEKFVKINEAYNVLKNVSSRREYDTSIRFGSPFQNKTPTTGTQTGNPFPGTPYQGGYQYEERGWRDHPYDNDPFAEQNYEYFQSRRSSDNFPEPNISKKAEEETDAFMNKVFGIVAVATVWTIYQATRPSVEKVRRQNIRMKEKEDT